MSLVDSSPAPAAIPVDEEELARARRARINRIAKWTLPSFVLVATILAWHLYVTIGEVPHYILPGPTVVFQTLLADWGLLSEAMMVTARLTLLALAMAILGGVGLAVAFTQSKWAEMSFFPSAVGLQVTRVIAIGKSRPDPVSAQSAV